MRTASDWFDEAHACLSTFARARAHGLIPNRFDDDAGPAHFNTVDAPLWFIHACSQWAKATGKPLCPELIDACEKGRDHDADPVKVRCPITGFELDAGFYSRNRDIVEGSSFSVLG